MNSMTGYGRAQGSPEGYQITVEYKSVNHRYFEFSARVPRGMMFLEIPLKETVKKYALRGKVEASVTVIPPADGRVNAQLQMSLAQQYVDALKTAAAPLGLEDNLALRDLLSLPELFQLEKEQENADEILALVLPVAEEAAKNFAEMRSAEGARLADDIAAKLDDIENMVEQIAALSPETLARYRERLYQKLKEVLEDKQIDEARILSETAIYADRIAVDEELTRLRSHLTQLRQMLSLREPVGRKLDFLLQETNREVNTIGSKAQDLAVSELVVELKVTLEKIREQIQNIE